MQVLWNPQKMGRVFVLPSAVTEEHLRMAGPVQLKVLLWLAAGNGAFDPDACARAIGRSAEECTDALQYWFETGVLLRPDGTAAAPVSPAPAEPAAPARQPAAFPRAVKPQMEQVLARRAQCAELGWLFDEVSARLGKPLSPSDMETLVYLYDTAALPAEVILLVVAYAVGQSKASMRYIEKTALGWADQGITTMEAAEQYLCRIRKRQECAEQIRVLLQMPAEPTVAQAERAMVWLTEWNMSEGLIRLACDQCVAVTGGCNFSYIHKVLEHWHADGVTDPAQVAESSGRTAGKKKSHNDSLDLNAYEQQLLTHAPVYKKRKV